MTRYESVNEDQLAGRVVSAANSFVRQGSLQPPTPFQGALSATTMSYHKRTIKRIKISRDREDEFKVSKEKWIPSVQKFHYYYIL